MASLPISESAVRKAVEDAVSDLVRVSAWGEFAFVNLPIFMPSGAPATVRVRAHRDGFEIDDGGFAYRELEALGFERSFPSEAGKAADAEELQKDRRRIWVVVPGGELTRAVCDVALASRNVVAAVYDRMIDADHAPESHHCWLRGTAGASCRSGDDSGDYGQYGVAESEAEMTDAPMIERVARVLRDTFGTRPYGCYDYGHNEDFYGPAPKAGRYVVRCEKTDKIVHQTNDRDAHEAAYERLTHEHYARAAIEEMRDPSEGMRVAGEETSGYCVETFRAMINAALEGK